MIIGKLYRIRVRNDFVMKTINGRRIKYLRGQWIVATLKEQSGCLMFLSEGIFFRQKRFDRFQSFKINNKIDSENDINITFQHLVEQYLHQRNQECDNDYF